MAEGDLVYLRAAKAKLIKKIESGSERIVNAVVEIAVNAFKFAVNEIGLLNPEKKNFCGEDLLQNLIDEISKKLNAIAAEK